MPLGTRKLELARQQEGTALTPGGRCLPALGRGLPVAKTVSVRALADIGETTLRCFANILLQQSRAGLEGTALPRGAAY